MATAAVGLPDINLAPDFIRFLFSTKPKFDCYFKVGNESQGKPERIGGVKLMLMAHSEVFRLELEESELKEKEEFPIKDIHPDTFKGMLKYVYGHDTTKEMCFDEADNLFYVAEKYLMKTLKDKLALRLMDLLNPDNICSLLNNPACHTHLELNSAITEILRYETDRVLESQQFLWMNADGFLKILEQDGLAVTEIELWRAAIKWAKHRANSDDGQVLRQQLSGLTQQLRPFTLTEVEVCEVIPSEVLTKDEVKTVCLYHGNKDITRELSDFSNEIEPRERLYKQIAHDELTTGGSSSEISSADYNFTFLTGRRCIELLPLVCQSRSRDSMNPENWTYKVESTTTITKVANQYDPNSSSSVDPPITVSSSQYVKCGVKFEIPLSVDGRNIKLQKDTKYTVTMKISGYHKRYKRHDTGKHSNDHLTLAIPEKDWNRYDGNFYYFPSDKFQYRATTKQ